MSPAKQTVLYLVALVTRPDEHRVGGADTTSPRTDRRRTLYFHRSRAPEQSHEIEQDYTFGRHG